MSQMNELMIYQKIYDMTLYGYICLRQFPKSEKHTLAADIKQCMYKMLRLTIAAQKKYHKKTTLQEIDIELEMLRTLIRLAADKDTRFISIKKYEIWSRHLAEIGKMLGGWIKATKK